MERLPVVAAVPNYNMASSLERLIPQLVNETYADVFILDDCSTDNSKEVVEKMNTRAIFSSSELNIGAGATRNRILSELSYHALIHFIDADCELLTHDIEAIANEIIPREPFGFVGGLSVKPGGIQHEMNYGPRQGLRSGMGGGLQSIIAKLVENDKVDQAKRIRELFPAVLEPLPDIANEPVRRQVYWNIEQNLLFDSETLAGVGGFDEHLREHEIQDLSIRLAKSGLKSYFDPRLKVRSEQIKVRQYGRPCRAVCDELYIARKHGLMDWLRN